MSNLLFPCYQRATLECGNLNTGVEKAYVCSGKRCDSQRLTSRALWSKEKRIILPCLSSVKTFGAAGIEDGQVAQCNFSTSWTTSCFVLCLGLTLNTRTTPGTFHLQHNDLETKDLAFAYFPIFVREFRLLRILGTKLGGWTLKRFETDLTVTHSHTVV